MSRICKEQVKEILMFSEYLGFRAASLGIIGRLGKIFSVSLNFFGSKKAQRNKGSEVQSNRIASRWLLNGSLRFDRDDAQNDINGSDWNGNNKLSFFILIREQVRPETFRQEAY